MLHDCHRHLDAVNESYFTHLRHALGFGLRMMGGGIGAILHGLCPALCQYTASKTVAALHEELQQRRARTPKE